MVDYRAANRDVRVYACLEGIDLWMLAEPFGVTEDELDQLLDEELPREAKERLFTIIARLGQCEGEVESL